TLRVASRSTRPPKLLQPRPTTETNRPDFPRFLCSIRSSGGEGRKNLLECGQLVAVERVGHEHRGVESGSVPLSEAVANFCGRAVERVVGNPAVGQVLWDVVAPIIGESLFDRPHLLAVSGF